MQNVTTTTAANNTLTANYTGVVDGKHWFSVSCPSSINDSDMFDLMRAIAESKDAENIIEHGGADENPVIEFEDDYGYEFVIKSRFVCVSDSVYNYIISVDKI